MPWLRHSQSDPELELDRSLSPTLSLPDLDLLDSDTDQPGQYRRSSNGYIYEDLPTTTSIRLLKLLPHHGDGPRRARVITVDLDEDSDVDKKYREHFRRLGEDTSTVPGPGYDCLSYVWGDRADPGSCVCDGYEVSITRSLARFFEIYDLEGRNGPIWVDRICINQDNLDELTRQVGLMDRVYTQARQVRIWLDDQDLHFDIGKIMRGLFTLQVWAVGFENDPRGSLARLGGAVHDYTNIRRSVIPSFSSIGGDIDEERWEEDIWAVKTLLQHPWFTRAWTYQESSLARYRWFYVGDRVCSDAVMEKAILAFFFISSTMRLRPNIKLFGNAVKSDDISALAHRGFVMMRHKDTTDEDEMRNSTLVRLLMARRRAGCQRKHDLVFSLLGCVRDRCGIIVDYSQPFSKLCYTVARYSLETSNHLQVLLCVDDVHKDTDGQNFQILNHPDWPHWVPNWARPGLECDVNYHYSCAKGKSSSVAFSSDGARLLVGGIILGCVDLIVDLPDHGSTYAGETHPSLGSPSSCSEEAQNIQDMLIERCEQVSTMLNVTALDLCRILLGDLDFFNFIDPDRPVGTGARRWNERIRTEISRVLKVKGNILTLCLGPMTLWTICRTENGLLSRIPRSLVQKGDIIAILWGHGLPFVLRKTPHGTYRVICDCYVDGKMDGQAILVEGDPGYEAYLESLTTFVFD